MDDGSNPSATLRRLPRSLTLSLSFLAWSTSIVVGLAVQHLQVIDPIDSISLLFLRAIPWVPLSYAWLYLSKVERSHLPLGPKGSRTLMAFRNSSNWLIVLGHVYASRHITMSIATTIFQAQPFTVSIVASRFLGESMNFQQRVCAGLSMIGEVLIAKPTFLFSDPGDNEVDHHGPGSIANSSKVDFYTSFVILWLCLIGMTLDAFATRKLRRSVSPGLILATSTLVAAVGSGALLLALRRPLLLPSSTEAWCYLIFIQILGTLGSTVGTWAFKFENTITIALIGQTMIVPAAIGDYVVFGSHFDLVSAVGANITTLAGMWGIAKSTSGQISQAPPESTRSSGGTSEASEAEIDGTERQPLLA